MNDFEYCLSTKFVFGKDAHKKAAKVLKGYGAENVLMVYYGDNNPKAIEDAIKYIKEDFKDKGIKYTYLNGVKPNPVLSTVHKGIEIARENDIDFILAIGGGSVIDTAKAIGIGVGYDGDVWDFFIGRSKIEKMLPVGVVLTYPATGSESSWGSVITNTEGNHKIALDDEHLRPTVAFMNPSLTLSLPKYLTACGVADMYAHVCERYFSDTNEISITDYMCEGVMRALIDIGSRLMDDLDDYKLRSEIMWAGSVAHNDTVGVGRVQDWACHKMGHEISAIYDTAHGATLSIMIPSWMRYVYNHNIERFYRYGKEVFKLSPDEFDNEEELVLHSIDLTQEFFKSMDLPTSFKDISITDENFDIMSKKASKTEMCDTIGHFMTLDTDDIKNIYKLAM